MVCHETSRATRNISRGGFYLPGIKTCKRTGKDRTMSQDLKNMFLHEKPALIAVTLLRKRKMHVRQISREIDATYSHTVKLMNRMHENELVVWQRSGRKKMYMLTPEGKDLAENLTRFFDTVNGENLAADTAGVGTVF